MKNAFISVFTEKNLYSANIYTSSNGENDLNPGAMPDYTSSGYNSLDHMIDILRKEGKKYGFAIIKVSVLSFIKKKGK